MKNKWTLCKERLPELKYAYRSDTYFEAREPNDIDCGVYDMYQSKQVLITYIVVGKKGKIEYFQDIGFLQRMISEYLEEPYEEWCVLTHNEKIYMRLPINTVIAWMPIPKPYKEK